MRSGRSLPPGALANSPLRVEQAEDIARLIAEYQEFEQKSEKLKEDALAVEGRLELAKTKTERETLQRLRVHHPAMGEVPVVALHLSGAESSEV